MNIDKEISDAQIHGDTNTMNKQAPRDSSSRLLEKGVRSKTAAKKIQSHTLLLLFFIAKQ